MNDNENEDKNNFINTAEAANVFKHYVLDTMYGRCFKCLISSNPHYKPMVLSSPLTNRETES